MNLKINFLDSHLNYFPENKGGGGVILRSKVNVFFRTLNKTDRRYQGKCDVNMMAEYCWIRKWQTTSNDTRRS